MNKAKLHKKNIKIHSQMKMEEKQKMRNDNKVYEIAKRSIFDLQNKTNAHSNHINQIHALR